MFVCFVVLLDGRDSLRLCKSATLKIRRDGEQLHTLGARTRMLRTMRESEVFKDEFEHLREGVRTELLPRLDDVRRIGNITALFDG